MNCKTHPGVPGVNTCSQCGEWLCEGCTIEINGRIFCRRCLAQLAGEPAAPSLSAPVRAAGGRHINWGLLFLFSCVIPIPGLNYMYEGLIKRGLAALSAFFLLIYLTAQFPIWPFSLIFGLSYPVYILACIFDGFHIRRRINAGETVSDDIDDILRFLKRNRYLILAFIVLLVALPAANSVLVSIARPLGRMLPVIVIGLGLYVVFKKPRKPRGRDADRDSQE